jgi:hypothetical protein
LLLSVLWLLLLTLRLSMLLLGMVLLCALLVLLCIRRSGDSEKQRQNGCAGDSNYFHRCYLQNCWLRNACPKRQACCCRVADTFAGHEKNNSLIFLSGRRSRRVAADFNGVSFVYRRSAGFLMVKTAHVKTEMVGRAE